MPKPLIDVILLDKYTKQNLGSFKRHKDTIKLIFSGLSYNVKNDIEEIESILDRKIHPLILDLYNIALTVYMSDLLIKRPPKTGYRNIKILISVSDKSKWDSVKVDLEGTLRFLSGDNYSFNFVQGARRKEFRFKVKEDKKAVCMFSGGLDSFAGVKWLLDKKILPILVSHCSQNSICSAQSFLSQNISSLFGKEVPFYQISARAKPGKDMQAVEYSQRSRSFLFLSLGVLFSLELGLKNLFIFENGVLAINIPITQARVYENTRTTHPDFIWRYANLIAKIFSVSIKFENPFLYKTKGEVVSILKKSGFENLIDDTITCSQQSILRYQKVKTSQISHCGICLPCILRKAAINFANLSKYDAKYAALIENGPKNLPAEGKAIFYELKDFSHKLNRCKDDTDVLLEFPQFYVENADVSGLIDMYRRYVTELSALLPF